MPVTVRTFARPAPVTIMAQLERSSMKMTTSKKISLSVGLLVLIVLLLPFAVIGEYWGMVWFYAAAPLSLMTEDTFGVNSDSFLLITVVSIGAAGVWAFLAYILSRFIANAMR